MIRKLRRAAAIFLCLAMIIGLMPVQQAYADQDPMEVTAFAITESLFPDGALRAWLTKTYGEEVNVGELVESTNLSLRWANIKDMTGMSNFIYLATLDCSNNQLACLDLTDYVSLTSLTCDDNKRTVTLDDNRQLDLSTISGFDVSKATDWNGGSVDENGILTFAEDASEVSYTYDCGRNFSASFTLKDIASINVTNVVEINPETFPDDVFREYIATVYDTNSDGGLSSSELNVYAARSINVESKNISSLKGIEYFTSLQTLYCDDNDLTELDVSKNTNLTNLYCYTNNLTRLTLGKNTKLSRLSCYGNSLTELDTSGCPNLRIITCSDNELTDIDASGLTNLYVLNCSENKLTTLDVSGDTVLESLDCSDNQLVELDISDSTESYFDLTCDNNQLKELTLSSGTGYLSCKNNLLESLDLSRCTNLSYMDCSGNRLTSLDLSNCTSANISVVYSGNGKDVTVDSDGKVDSSELPDFDYTRATAVAGCTISSDTLTFDEGRSSVMYSYDCGNGILAEFILTDPSIVSEELAIDETNFPDEIFRTYVSTNFDKDGNGALSQKEQLLVDSISIYGKTNLTSLQGIEYFPALKKLECCSNSLTSLDVSGNVELQSLSCYGNKLQELDLSENKNLQTVSCYNNQLTSLNVGSCAKITKLYCYGNQLTELDVNGLSALTDLKCQSNSLTTLDVSRNSALLYLTCSGNQLTEINVTGNAELLNLSCGDNSISEIDISGNQKLYTLWCEDNELQNLDVSVDAALINLNCEGNALASLDVSKNTNLKDLRCSNCGLTSLDVSQNIALTGLTCDENQLTELDLSNNTNLANVYCRNNKLREITPCDSVYYYQFQCSYNELVCAYIGATNLGISNNQRTITVDQNNQFDLSTFAGFDVAKASSWTGGTVDGTILTVNSGTTVVTYYYNCRSSSDKFTLNIQECGIVDVDEEHFPDPLFREYVSSHFDTDKSGSLSASEINKATEIGMYDSEVTDLTGIEYLTQLKSISCVGNMKQCKLAVLDVSKNEKLETLRCGNNALTSLDLSGNPALTKLECYGNQLTSLDLSSNEALTTINIGTNNSYTMNAGAPDGTVSLEELKVYGFDPAKASDFKCGSTELTFDADTCTLSGLTGAVDGYYSVSYSYDTGNEVAGAATFNLKIPDVDFYGSSLSLKGYVDVNFYLEPGTAYADDETAYVEFLIPGETNPQIVYQKDLEPNSEGLYKFICYVTAREMNDEITADYYVVKNGEPQKITSMTYSVVQYAKDMIEDSSTESAYPGLTELLKALVNYGASAQKEFGYRTDELANAFLSAEDQTVSEADFTAYESSVEENLSGLSYYGASLILKSRTDIRHYFTLESGSITDYTASVKLEDGTVESLKWVQKNDTSYYVAVPNIAARKLGQVYEVTVTDGTDSTIISNYSALSYGYDLSKEDELLQTLLDAMYAYNQAAITYFNNSSSN